MCKNNKDNIFGGYASISWTSDNGGYKYANGSFLFTLTNIYGIAPTKFPNTQNQNYAVYHGSSYGPIFGSGHDLYIRNDYFNNKVNCNLGSAYPDIIGKGSSIFTGDASNNDKNIVLKELEVFKLK